MENMKKECKIIFNLGCARQLLRMGYPIVDIKPDRDNPDKTLFVFKRTPEFLEAFAQINREIAEAKLTQEAQ